MPKPNDDKVSETKAEKNLRELTEAIESLKQQMAVVLAIQGSPTGKGPSKFGLTAPRAPGALTRNPGGPFIQGGGRNLNIPPGVIGDPTNALLGNAIGDLLVNLTGEREGNKPSIFSDVVNTIKGLF